MKIAENRIKSQSLIFDRGDGSTFGYSTIFVQSV